MSPKEAIAFLKPKPKKIPINEQKKVKPEPKIKINRLNASKEAHSRAIREKFPFLFKQEEFKKS
jgi:hypothetical protein